MISTLVDLGPGFRCTGTLVELSAELAERARQAAASEGLDITVLTADAADPRKLAAQIPSDVLVLCGIFGNISDGDVDNTIEHAGGLVREGGFVIWTRHRRSPDLTPAIRRRFAACGFEEVAFTSGGEDAWSVGLHRNVDAPVADITAPLFTFVV